MADTATPTQNAEAKNGTETKTPAARTADGKTLQPYEAMFLLPAGTAGLEGALTLVRGIIERHGGQITVLKKWDERKLAYEVNKQKRGLYVIAFFNAPGGAVAAIERDVNLSDNMLRVLLTKADHLSEKEMSAVEPQAIVPREERPGFDRPWSDRGERGDRGGDRGFDRGGDRGGERPAEGGEARPAAGGDNRGGGEARPERPPRRPRREDGPAGGPPPAAPAGDKKD